MDKKFYFEPELEVIDLELEGALLSDSDPNIGDDNGGNKGDEGGSDDF